MEALSGEGQGEASAKARHGRRKAIAAVAVLVLVAGGIGVWRILERNGPDNDVHVTGPGLVSTGPALEWVEFDPGLDEAALSGILISLGDGRILVSASGEEDDGAVPGLRFLVTENGVDWSEVPMPPGIWPLSHDLTGERWLVAGYDLAGESILSAMETEGICSRALSMFRAFFSDDQGANWTELEFDFSSSSIQVPPACEFPPFFVSAALTSGEHMVVVLWGEETVESAAPDSGGRTFGESEDNTGESGKSWIFASDGEAFIQVADYDGSIYGAVYGWSFGTPAGFSLFYVEGGTGQAPVRLSTLASPDGRIWSQNESAGFYNSTAFGPDGSLWRTTWLGAGYGLHQYDREGTLTTKVAIDNSLPFLASAGPSGVAVTAMTSPGTDLFTLPDRRIVKEGYELRLNEPEGGFSLWELATDTAVYECGQEVIWAQGLAFAEGACEFVYPVTDNADMDSVVLVFEDRQTGAELASFTRGELLPSFPLWMITGLTVDGPENEEQWLGWSADGAKWGWQTPADAFGIEPSEADDRLVELAVGDGFVLARIQHYDDYSPYFSRSHWFIAQAP